MVLHLAQALGVGMVDSGFMTNPDGVELCRRLSLSLRAGGWGRLDADCRRLGSLSRRRHGDRELGSSCVVDL